MPLVAQSSAANLPLQDWRRQAHDDLAARLNRTSGFPCSFSINAFGRGLVRYLFVDGFDPAVLGAAGHEVRNYVAESAAWDGRINTARPLVVMFSPDSVWFPDADGYRDFGWRVLQTWHDTDPVSWPDAVSRDPETPFWSFCMGGMQLFVNMSTPAHATRRSRNLGKCFTMVINPRERFDIVAGDNPAGRRLRNRIRARAEIYDGLPHSPLLGSFTRGDLEWPQYFLPDGNETAPGRCPFRFRDA